jgi:cytidyltransferase-like protein
MNLTSKKTIAITSLYANPLHPGHIECLRLSKECSDELWVIVNNDHQAKLKRGVKSFQDEKFRLEVIQSLKYVDRAMISIDTDASVCKSLESLIKEAQSRTDVEKVIFTKGGDRFAHEIPEKVICDAYGVSIVDWLWQKTHNSSDLVRKLSNQNDLTKLEESIQNLPKSLKEENYLEIGYRPWWVYYVLEEGKWFKVKKIIVNPWMRLSLQSHKNRSEHWIVVSGIAGVDLRSPEFSDIAQIKVLTSNQWCHIPKQYLHRLANIWTEPLAIIEVQCGDYLWEDDITRFEDDFKR